MPPSVFQLAAGTNTATVMSQKETYEHGILLIKHESASFDYRAVSDLMPKSLTVTGYVLCEAAKPYHSRQRLIKQPGQPNPGLR